MSTGGEPSRRSSTVTAGDVLRALWQRRRGRIAERSEYQRHQSDVSSPALIINRWSGDGKAERYGLADAAAELGIKTIMLEPGNDLTRLAETALDEGADAVGMAGGDGSLGLVAAVAAAGGVPFFCIPVGTRNHFALDVGLNRDAPLSALAAFEDGEEIVIDVGMAGDRMFVNNVSLGVYAEAVHQDEYRGAKAETLANALRDTAFDASNQPSLIFDTPDGKSHQRTPLVLVSNNPYVNSGPPDFGRRPDLNRGTLGVGVVTNSTHVDNTESFGLGSGMNLHNWESKSFAVDSETGSIRAAVDGEALEFPAPLHFDIKEGGLRLLVPAGTRPGYVRTGKQIASALIDYATLGGDAEIWSDPRL